MYLKTRFWFPAKTDEFRVASRPRHSPYPLTPVPEAISIILTNSLPLPTTTLTNLQGTNDVINILSCLCKLSLLSDALGFVLSEDLFSYDPFPPFRASVKDGYAVIGMNVL